MSHNAKYVLGIKNAYKPFVDATVKYLEQLGLITVKPIVRGYNGNEIKAQGYGVWATEKLKTYAYDNWGVDIRVHDNGTIEFSGESMAYENSAEFQALFQKAYVAIAQRWALIQKGYKTQMQMVESEGKKKFVIMGVD